MNQREELPAAQTLYGREWRRPEPWAELERRGRRLEEVAWRHIEMSMAERAKEGRE